MGIRSPRYNPQRLVSESASEELLRDIARVNSGFSLTLWIKQQHNLDPKNNSTNNGKETEPQSLLALGHTEAVTEALDSDRTNENNLPASSSLFFTTPCEKYGFDLHLVQQSNVFDVYFRTSEQVFEPCHRLRIPNFAANNSSSTSPQGMNADSTLTHLAISLTHGLQQVFFNGQLVQSSYEAFANDLSHWNNKDTIQKDYDSSKRLAIFSYPGFAPWLGALYQLELLSGGLTTATVQSRLRQGLIPSPPVAMPASIYIHEDAERNPESHEPTWYSQQQHISSHFLRNEADTIPLPVQSVQQEGLELLKSLDLVPSNETVFLHRYITRPPSVGELYLKNGRPLGPALQEEEQPQEGEAEIWEVVSSTDIVYVPPHNAHSKTFTQNDTLRTFTSLEYCVSAQPILHARECNSATIEIYVRPVNDPPIPNQFRPDNPIVLHEGDSSSTGVRATTTPKILLTGTDVDDGDFVQSVKITSPPEYGNLVLSVGTFRQDGLVHGTALNTLDYLVHGRENVYLQYEWDPWSKFTGSLQGVVHDQFSFSVADKFGRWSVEETVPLEIYSAVTVVEINLTIDMNSVDDGKDDNNVWSSEQQPINISIPLRDASGYNRTLGVYFDSAPVGMLVDPATRQPVSNGTILLSSSHMDNQSSSAVVELGLLRGSDFCTTSENQDHTFRFSTKALALDKETGRIKSTSERVGQQVHVHCRPAPLYWIVDRNCSSSTSNNCAYWVSQSDPRLSSLDPCSGGRFNASSNAMPLYRTNCSKRALVLENVTVQSKTPLSWMMNSLVEVEITSQTGYLTLNEEHWNKTQPRQGRRLESRGMVRFLVYPADIQSVLAFLHYQSPKPGNDVIEFVLYQGNCTSYYRNKTEMNRSDDNACHVARQSISIVVQTDPERNWYQTSLVSGFQWQILVCLVGYPLIYLLLVHLESWIGSTLRRRDYYRDDVEGEEDNCPHWIQYETNEGDFYYENTITGEVTWMAPVGQSFARWSDLEAEQDNDMEN
ncbi:hypothetical protein ACA910_010617 [Epithemia clementina (nom. ined.)]